MSTLARHFIIFSLIMIVFAFGLLAAVQNANRSDRYRSGYLLLPCTSTQTTTSNCRITR